MGSRWRQRARLLCALLLLPLATSYALPSLALLGVNGVLACCRAQQHCCCRRSTHTNYSGAAWTTKPGCERRCGFVTGPSGALVLSARPGTGHPRPVTRLAALASASYAPALFIYFISQRPPPADQRA